MLLGFSSLRAMDSIRGLDVTMSGVGGGGGASFGKRIGPFLEKSRSYFFFVLCL